MPAPRTHIRVVRSDGREWPSLSVAYRELLGTPHELAASEAQRLRALVRSGLNPRDRHGFTWRSMGGTVAENTIRWTDFTFGVELEIDGVSIDQFRMGNNLRSWGFPTWRVVRDGSVSGVNPMEVVSPVLQGEAGLTALRSVLDHLREAGCKVNSSCGMHVHVGVRGMKPERVRKIAIAFLNAEQHFDAIVPPARRNNRYCQSNAHRFSSHERGELEGATTIRQLAYCMNGGSAHEHYNSFRYYKLNFQSFVHHGTIEFRQHAGSVESQKACAWVRLLTGFCAQAAGSDQQHVGDRQDFAAWLATVTDEEGQRYMTARREKFAAATARAAA